MAGSASQSAFREQICCFGDSITQHGNMPYGWVSQLAEQYRRRCDVFNRGFSGYNSAHGRAMTRYVFGPTRKYLISTVFFGANDAADVVLKPDQHVSVAAYAENLMEIVEAARKVGVVPFPMIDDVDWENELSLVIY